MKKGGVILIFFGLFWSGMTLLFDGFTIGPAIRQVLAKEFATTQGTVLTSEVTHHSDSDGTTHGVRITYSYTVGGHEYTGDRYRYNKMSSSDSGWAHQAVREHPVGSTTMVHYDPNNPADAVLRVGLAGSDLFLALFMTPFNAVMLGFWWWGWSRLRRRWQKPVAGGIKLRTNFHQTRALMTEFSPWATIIAATGLLAFLSIFVVAFGFGGFHPSLRVMTVTWIVVLAGGVFFGGWHWKHIVEGKYDLVVDELSGTLQLPLTHGRKTRNTVAFAEVQGAYVETIAKTDSEGAASHTYVPTLRLGNAEGRTEKLADWHDEDKAREFIAWLNERLGPRTAAPPVPPLAPQPIRLRPER